ncbi:MAG: GCN5-related N-acetyltransferase, partial [Nocardioidaceae bacterium]|nr:GCN5-related N-acetyltransferase [Nocardioidaceae bacterium]
LVAAGAELDENLTVLARPVATPAPADPSFALRRALDPDTLRDHETVAIEAFGGEMPSDEWIAKEVTRLRGRFDTGQALSVVAYRDDEPVGIGGVSIADGFARLWNGATTESARRQGVYTAVTAARATFARERGARGLLTKARVETSAPILRRAGFTAYGEERSYRFDVST